MMVSSSGTFQLGTDVNTLEFFRLGFGAMRITGPGIWGYPSDVDSAKAVLRRAVANGVNFIDTADSYGPEVSEVLIAETLRPYRDVVIATKGGLTRQGPGQWAACGHPAYLKQCIEMSLRRLKVESIDLYQLHRIDDGFPLADQIGVLKEAQDAGKIQHIGLSEVSVEQIEEVSTIVKVATVQNLYNIATRGSDEVLRFCEARGIGFIPWFPLGGADVEALNSRLSDLSEESGHTGAQLALAWLLAKSEVMLPIPGTASVIHLDENCQAGQITLTPELFGKLDALV
jgi:aryl-alcohol dehydrogenase-like predicted oxidoreductase